MNQGWKFCAGLALLIVAAPALAQTSRENAVAIDRVELPPSDDVGLNRLVGGLRAPWSLAVMPDGAILLVEKHHGLRLWSSATGLGALIVGVPTNVLAKVDSGFLDIALDPDFTANQHVYLAFAEGDEAANRTAIWRARWNGSALVDGRVIFRVNVDKKAPSHPGGRLLFLPDKTLLLSVGDGYDYRNEAQNMRSHLGKVLRLTRDGGVPADNPFVGRSDVAPEIWTSGHRNIQGLAIDPETGFVWASDHGPRGGDRVSRLQAGQNHGWPRITHGLDYDGTIIAAQHSDPRFAVAQMVWMPSIAPSGLAVYRGAAFPDWNGKFLSGGLASRALHRMRAGRETGLFIEEARMFAPLGARIRDVRVGPGGEVLMLTDDATNGQLLQIVSPPSASEQAASPLAPLLFLLGRWTGESRFQRAFDANAAPIDAISTTDCRRAVQNRYLRCITDFVRPSGRRRVVEHSIQSSEDGTGFDFVVLNGNAPGQSRYAMRWDAALGAFEALLPTEHDGKPATERIRLTPNSDRTELVHTEELRLDAQSEQPWQLTFRWVWRRAR